MFYDILFELEKKSEQWIIKFNIQLDRMNMSSIGHIQGHWEERKNDDEEEEEEDVISHSKHFLLNYVEKS